MRPPPAIRSPGAAKWSIIRNVSEILLHARWLSILRRRHYREQVSRAVQAQRKIASYCAPKPWPRCVASVRRAASTVSVPWHQPAGRVRSPTRARRRQGRALRRPPCGSRSRCSRQCLRTFTPPFPMPKVVTPEFLADRRSDGRADSKLGSRHPANAAALRRDAPRPQRNMSDPARRRARWCRTTSPSCSHRSTGFPQQARRHPFDQEKGTRHEPAHHSHRYPRQSRSGESVRRSQNGAGSIQESVGDCYIAIALASRYHMDPWTLMQEMYIISGKPMMSGKLSAAILNNSLAEPLRPGVFRRRSRAHHHPHRKAGRRRRSRCGR